MARTPAIAAVERAGIVFTVAEYDHDPNAESYGLEAAEKLGVDPARVFKTLVVEIDGTPLIALGKRAALAKPADAERITGYVTGGISPLGQRRRLRTLVHESVLTFETVFVSAGRRGLELELAPGDLLALTGGEVRALAADR
jgi:Cys-tRNA(Pro)/Cys-tRNA(Cys) deacylase